MEHQSALVLIPVIIASLAVSFAAAQQDASPERDQHVHLIMVCDQSGLFRPSEGGQPVEQPEFFLATSLNGWDPRGHRGRTDCGDYLSDPCRSAFSLPAAVVDDPLFEFKFTRGGWERVEVDRDGRDIANRRIVDGRPGKWIDGKRAYFFDVEGWADQRGERWPAAGIPSTVTGDLRIHELTSAILGNTRKIRVWLPPGYEEADASSVPPPDLLPRGGGGIRYPVLYMHDGQNLFDDATSFAGEWAVDETLTRLIGEGKVPPMIVVGIDNAGAARADELSPVPIGGGRAGGGKGDLYLQFIADEVMPLINREYRTLTGPEHTFMGGSSLGGVITLRAAMTMPGKFGAILVESPALWVGDGEFLKMVTAHGNWPPRVFMAMGGTEYGDAARDRQLVEQVRKAEAAIGASVKAPARLRVVVEPDARHNEAAWRARFAGACEFLFGR